MSALLPVLVGGDLGRAVGVDDDVVPGGHLLAMLVLAGIPVGGDVVLRAGEHGEGVDRGGEGHAIVDWRGRRGRAGFRGGVG